MNKSALIVALSVLISGLPFVARPATPDKQLLGDSVPAAVISVISNPHPASSKEAGIPAKYIIANVPLFLQGKNECGPTSLSMVMSYYGIRETAGSLKSALKWHVDNGVSYQDMLHFPYQRYGLEVGFAGESDLNSLLAELSQNQPILVRQWADSREKQIGLTGHWRLAIGYDQEAKKIYLQDPMFVKTISLDYGIFLDLWDMSSHSNPTMNYMLLLRKTSRGTPASAKEGRMS